MTSSTSVLSNIQFIFAGPQVPSLHSLFSVPHAQFSPHARQWLDAVSECTEESSLLPLLRATSSASTEALTSTDSACNLGVGDDSKYQFKTEQGQSTVNCHYLPSRAAAFFHWSRVPARIIINPGADYLTYPDAMGPHDAACKDGESLYMILNGERQRGMVRGFVIPSASDRLGFGNLRDVLRAMFSRLESDRRTLKIRFTLTVFKDQQRVRTVAAGHFWVIGDRVFNPAILATESKFEESCLLIPLWVGVPATEQSFQDAVTDFNYPGADPSSTLALIGAVRSLTAALESSQSPSSPDLLLSLAVGLFRQSKRELATQFLSLAALAHSYRRLCVNSADKPRDVLAQELAGFRSIFSSVMAFLRHCRSVRAEELSQSRGAISTIIDLEDGVLPSRDPTAPNTPLRARCLHDESMELPYSTAESAVAPIIGAKTSEDQVRAMEM